MRVHHLNCGTMKPLGGRIDLGVGNDHMVCHCLLIELGSELVLVDSGLGLRDVADASRRLGRLFTSLVGPLLSEAETAARQIEALGFSTRDVRHVVLTHLDVDHAGGIADFPEARIHVLAAEHAAAMAPAFAERVRYRDAQWAHGPLWELHEPTGEPWFGFEAVRELRGLPPEILLIPLLGHTRGHAGIAVRDGDGWLMHAGDAYFHHGQMDPDVPCCPPALSLFQAVVQRLPELRRANVERLRELARDHDDVHVFSAHDQTELLRHS